MGGGFIGGLGFKGGWDVLRIACLLAMGGGYVGCVGFKGIWHFMLIVTLIASTADGEVSFSGCYQTQMCKPPYYLRANCVLYILVHLDDKYNVIRSGDYMLAQRTQV